MANTLLLLATTLPYFLYIKIYRIQGKVVATKTKKISQSKKRRKEKSWLQIIR
jgi:hypothetical protein